MKREGRQVYSHTDKGTTSCNISQMSVWIVNSSVKQNLYETAACTMNHQWSYTKMLFDAICSYNCRCTFISEAISRCATMQSVPLMKVETEQSYCVTGVGCYNSKCTLISDDTQRCCVVQYTSLVVSYPTAKPIKGWDTAVNLWDKGL